MFDLWRAWQIAVCDFWLHQLRQNHFRDPRKMVGSGDILFFSPTHKKPVNSGSELIKEQ